MDDDPAVSASVGLITRLKGNSRVLKVTHKRMWLILCLLVILTRSSALKRDVPSVPLCSKGILNKRSFVYNNNNSMDGYWAMKRPDCRLHRYSQPDAIKCLDALVHERNQQVSKALHFAFVGDSRIRIQFYDLLKLMPGNSIAGSRTVSVMHQNIKVRIPLLNPVLFTFHWMPRMERSLMELIARWASDPSPPYFILLGLSAHMMKEEDKFRKGLTRLAPLLDELSRQKSSRIVWLNQYPALDFVFDNRETGRNPEIGTDKLGHFNEIVRSILIDKGSSVELWDSMDPVVKEYVRSCYAHRQRTSEDNHLNTWMECDDYIHVSRSVLSQSSQLLLNDICNGLAVMDMM